MKTLLLLVISILPVVVLAYFIYKKDFNKEPLKLLIKLFFGGILSLFLTLIVTAVLENIFPFFKIDFDKLNIIELVISVFIGVALIEESSKWIFLYTFSYKDKEFDEFYDMIVYSVFVSLGFACLENIGYVLLSGIGTGILRGILSVPGHAFYGVFMGYYLGLAKIASLNNNKQLENKNKVFSILIPTFLHGIYDYCLFSKLSILYIIFVVFIIFLYIFSIKKVNKISNIRGKMMYSDKYCPNCGIRVESDYCPICGRKND